MRFSQSVLVLGLVALLAALGIGFVALRSANSHRDVMLGALQRGLERAYDQAIAGHCHPAMASRICWILFQIGMMELERGVSDLSAILAFRKAGSLPNSRNAYWKKRLRSSHGLSSSRAVPPLCRPLPR